MNNRRTWLTVFAIFFSFFFAQNCVAKLLAERQLVALTRNEDDLHGKLNTKTFSKYFFSFVHRHENRENLQSYQLSWKFIFIHNYLSNSKIHNSWNVFSWGVFIVCPNKLAVKPKSQKSYKLRLQNFAFHLVAHPFWVDLFKFNYMIIDTTTATTTTPMGRITSVMPKQNNPLAEMFAIPQFHSMKFANIKDFWNFSEIWFDEFCAQTKKKKTKIIAASAPIFSSILEI